MDQKLDLDALLERAMTVEEPTYFSCAVIALITRIQQLERASQPGSGEADTARLDFLAGHDAWIAWSKDGEVCRVFCRDGDDDCMPIMGWRSPWFSSPREAIDAARAALAGREG